MFSEGINQYAFPIAITKTREVRFLIHYSLMLHCKFVNASQVSLRKSNRSSGEHEKRTK